MSLQSFACPLLSPALHASEQKHAHWHTHRGAFGLWLVSVQRLWVRQRHLTCCAVN